MTPPDGLQIGDDCFAAGTVIEKKWFRAKLISVRARSPPMRIEYISTLDGQTNELLLPSPRKDYVHIEQICRHKPEQIPEAPQARRGAHNERVEEKKIEEPQAVKAADEDEFVIAGAGHWVNTSNTSYWNFTNTSHMITTQVPVNVSYTRNNTLIDSMCYVKE